MNTNETFLTGGSRNALDLDPNVKLRNEILRSLPYTKRGAKVIISKLNSDWESYQNSTVGTIGIDIQEPLSVILEVEGGGLMQTSPLCNSYFSDTVVEGQDERILVLVTNNSTYHLIPAK